jgi:hypothetical protein
MIRGQNKTGLGFAWIKRQAVKSIIDKYDHLGFIWHAAS